ncbi:MAG: CDP-alcohol phosphatidyltransferase family protein [Prolixibacteraceae bacterium]|nr:CDP-alcohol phosphatidyltransferase family protein [Prolixibacteraceae bacterium]
MKLIIKGENVLNVPNAISFYRLVVSPLILALAIMNQERWFVILICISLVSDILDGNIARYFNLRTYFGAALDNLADMCTYALALLGIFRFRWDSIEPHAWVLYLFLAVFILSYIIAFIRFGKIPGLHLYSAVSAGYIQGIFFFILFVWGFFPWIYYLAVGCGVIAYIEKIFVLLKLDDIKFDVKGLYWLLKSQNQK